MILASAHATVHADVLVADHAHQVVLLSMAGPKTAVKAIYAALRSNHKPWLNCTRRGQDRARSRRMWRLPLLGAGYPAPVCAAERADGRHRRRRAVPGRLLLRPARDGRWPGAGVGAGY